jgi:hypothetical protein
MEVTVDPAELLAGFDHPGGALTQRHHSVLPVFDVAGVFRQISIMLSTKLVLRRVRARVGATPRRSTVRISVSPSRNEAAAGVGAFQLTGQGLKLGLGTQRGLGVSGLGVIGRAHPLGHHRTQLLGPSIMNISQLMQVCRRRHNLHYADLGIMPRWMVCILLTSCFELGRST